MSDAIVHRRPCPLCQQRSQFVLVQVLSPRRQAAAISVCGCEIGPARIPVEYRRTTPSTSLVEAAKLIVTGTPVMLDGAAEACGGLEELFTMWGDLSQHRSFEEQSISAGPVSSLQNVVPRRGATTVAFSVVKNVGATRRNPGALLTKRFELSESGELTRSVETELVDGQLRVVKLSTPEELATLIGTLGPQEALMLGVPRNGMSETHLLSRKNARRGDPGITRTLEDVVYPVGGGILFLDFDHLPPNASLEDVARQLTEVIPALAQAPMVLIPSASSHIYDTSADTQLRGLSGVHVYIWLENAGDAPEIGARLRDHMILAGHGWCFISKAGTPSVRVPFDTAVFQPVRLVFAAGAVCSPPLQQRRGEPLVLNSAGRALTLDSVPALPEPERERVRAFEQVILEKHHPEIEAARAAYREERIAKGVPSDVIDRMLEHHELEGDFPVQFSDGQVCSVRDILADPQRFHERDCYDPEEPDYQGGKVVAKLFHGADGVTRIHSYAHGRRVFTLVRDAVEQARSARSDFSSAIRPLRHLRPFSEVESVPIEWLLPGRLARREITMINGWPGEGKTSVVIDIAAKLSRGMKLPDGSMPPGPLRVLVVSTEDNESVLKLRLRAAGADLDQVFTVGELVEQMRLPSGRQLWIDLIREHSIDVVVVDPLMAFIDDGLKNIAEQDARKVMQALREVLLETNAAAFCIRHPNKATASGNMNAVSAASGSLAFTAAARIEMIVGRLPNSENTRALACVKNNLAAMPPTLLYTIEASVIELSEADGLTQEVASVNWAGVDDSITAEDLLARRESREVRTRLDEAKRFLESMLGDGPVSRTEVLKAARRQGIEKRTLERARSEIGWTQTDGNLRYGGTQVWGLKGQSLDEYLAAKSGGQRSGIANSPLPGPEGLR